MNKKNNNPRGNKKGGKTRRYKKISPTTKFISINKDYFATGSKPDWKKIKDVAGLTFY